jgi:hypothetical protein
MIDAVASALGFGSGWGAKALARNLPGKQLKVAALSESVARALELAGHTVVRASLENQRLALEDESCDALCASGLPPPEQAHGILRECARVVRSGGLVVLATPYGLARRGPERHRVSALFLHAGLVEITQRMSSGIVLTSGRVRR